MVTKVRWLAYHSLPCYLLLSRIHPPLFCPLIIHPVTPEDMAKMIKKRIQLSDCASQGYLIEGFPANQQQVAAFHQSAIEASLYVMCDGDDDDDDLMMLYFWQLGFTSTTLTGSW